MAKFIEVTDYDAQSLYINVDNILWVEPYEAENGSMIFMSVLIEDIKNNDIGFVSAKQIWS